jgi:hypothetical protein
LDYNRAHTRYADRRKSLALIIRQQQLGALQPIAEAALVRKIARHILTNHGDSIVRCSSGTFTIAQAPNDVVEELIRAGIRSARRYGLSWESSLAAFVVLMFVVSPNFDDCSSVWQVLLDPSKPPDCRLRELWDETTEDEWEQMRENYNPDAWVLREEGGGFV